MSQFTLNSATDQLNYVSDQVIGFLDTDLQIDFGDVPKGSSSYLELYIENTSTDNSTLESPYLMGVDGEGGLVYGRWALSTTPGLALGSPMGYEPSGKKLYIGELKSGDRIYFFMQMNVSSSAASGLSKGPSVKLKGSIA